LPPGLNAPLIRARRGPPPSSPHRRRAASEPQLTPDLPTKKGRFRSSFLGRHNTNAVFFPAEEPPGSSNFLPSLPQPGWRHTWRTFRSARGRPAPEVPEPSVGRGCGSFPQIGKPSGLGDAPRTAKSPLLPFPLGVAFIIWRCGGACVSVGMHNAVVQPYRWAGLTNRRRPGLWRQGAKTARTPPPGVAKTNPAFPLTARKPNCAACRGN